MQSAPFKGSVFDKVKSWKMLSFFQLLLAAQQLGMLQPFLFRSWSLENNGKNPKIKPNKIITKQDKCKKGKN